jgi:hypothetical protein
MRDGVAITALVGSSNGGGGVDMATGWGGQGSKPEQRVKHWRGATPPPAGVVFILFFLLFKYFHRELGLKDVELQLSLEFFESLLRLHGAIEIRVSR